MESQETKTFPVTGAIWQRVREAAPVLEIPRAQVTGEPVLVDCLLGPAGGSGPAPGLLGPGVWIARQLAPDRAWNLVRDMGVRWPAAWVMLGLDPAWPIFGLRDAGGELSDSDRVQPCPVVLDAAGRGRVGLALPGPGQGLCPVFAYPRWAGATGGLLVASPVECATVCLEVKTTACVDGSGRMNWRLLRQAMVQGVNLGNAILDRLPVDGDLLGLRSRKLRRLSLHLADLGHLAGRLGMAPEHPSTLSSLHQVVRVAVDAAQGESLRLGRRHGPFPALAESDWVGAIRQPVFRQRVQSLQQRFCLRNSHLVSLSPHSLLAPARESRELMAWANLLPLLAVVDGFCSRLPPAWAGLSPGQASRLLGRILALGRSADRVRAY